MEVSCKECGHGLWAEEVPVADRFGVLACFDDEKRSDTYAEQVQRCPGCGCWLNAKVLLGACEEARSGIVAPPSYGRRASEEPPSTHSGE